LTTIGEVPGPQENVEFAFVTMDLMCGVLIFATIVGNVGRYVAGIKVFQTEFIGFDFGRKIDTFYLTNI
jgi:hypothetical protein